LVAPEPQPFTPDERALLHEIVGEKDPSLLDLVARLSKEDLVPRAENEPLSALLFAELDDEWGPSTNWTERARLIDALISKVFQHNVEFWA
jgi:hypothetical protein